MTRGAPAIGVSCMRSLNVMTASGGVGVGVGVVVAVGEIVGVTVGVPV